MLLAKWMGGEIQVQLIQFVTEWQLTMGWHSDQTVIDGGDGDGDEGRREKKCLACDKTHFHLSLFSSLLYTAPSSSSSFSPPICKNGDQHDANIQRNSRERDSIWINVCLCRLRLLLIRPLFPQVIEVASYKQQEAYEGFRTIALALSDRPTDRQTHSTTLTDWVKSLLLHLSLSIGTHKLLLASSSLIK